MDRIVVDSRWILVVLDDCVGGLKHLDSSVRTDTPLIFDHDVREVVGREKRLRLVLSQRPAGRLGKFGEELAIRRMTSRALVQPGLVRDSTLDSLIPASLRRCH